MGNSLLYGLPDLQIKHLSCLQNIAARIITRTKPTEHITPVLRDLPIGFQSRTELSSNYIVYKSNNSISPLYTGISNLLTRHKQERHYCVRTAKYFSLNRDLQNPGDRFLFYVLQLAYGISFWSTCNNCQICGFMLKTLIMKSECDFFD